MTGLTWKSEDAFKFTVSIGGPDGKPNRLTDNCAILAQFAFINLIKRLGYIAVDAYAFNGQQVLVGTGDELDEKISFAVVLFPEKDVIVHKVELTRFDPQPQYLVGVMLDPEKPKSIALIVGYARFSDVFTGEHISQRKLSVDSDLSHPLGIISLLPQ